MFFSKSEEEPPPQLLKHRADGHDVAVVFVHGFQGDSSRTWAGFPQYLMDEPSLSQWDVLSVGYTTNLRIDLARVWSAAAPLDRLALLLVTVAKSQLSSYKRLAIIAHSMGGLIVQRALLNDTSLAGRASHVLLFGTPSAGLSKAGFVRFWKRQLRDMAEGSKFIEQLRADWRSRFPQPPFQFLAIAGSEDEFVPSDSSLGPFASEYQAVVNGDHLTMVKPTGLDHLSVRLVVRQIVGDAAATGPWNAARVAVERGEFQRAIERLEPHKAELDESNLVYLALALEGVGRENDAIQLLELSAGKGMTDAMGVLAGRLKRRWLASGRAADAEHAYALYERAKTLAMEQDNSSQAYYHAINLAFLDLAFYKQTKKAQIHANLALHQVHRANGSDYWALATQAEAFLYLGDDENALSKYRQALSAAPSPRAVESIFEQAVTAAGCVNNAPLIQRLTMLFRDSARYLES